MYKNPICQSQAWLAVETKVNAGYKIAQHDGNNPNIIIQETIVLHLWRMANHRVVHGRRRHTGQRSPQLQRNNRPILIPEIRILGAQVIV